MAIFVDGKEFCNYLSENERKNFMFSSSCISPSFFEETLTFINREFTF